MKLSDLLFELGESEVKNILSSFLCPLNRDVEDFIRNKAIEFSKQGLAKTTLVYWRSDDRKEKYLAGYFSIASKYICVSKDEVSNSMARRLNKHGTFDNNTREYIVPAPLIAPLSKNFAEGNDCLVYGSDLLKMALNKVREIQDEIGGKFVYLECEDKPQLIQFYEANGFKIYGKRSKDRDEIGVDGEYLIQLLQYLK